MRGFSLFLCGAALAVATANAQASSASSSQPVAGPSGSTIEEKTHTREDGTVTTIRETPEGTIITIIPGENATSISLPPSIASVVGQNASLSEATNSTSSPEPPSAIIAETTETVAQQQGEKSMGQFLSKSQFMDSSGEMKTLTMFRDSQHHLYSVTQLGTSSPTILLLNGTQSSVVEDPKEIERILLEMREAEKERERTEMNMEAMMRENMKAMEMQMRAVNQQAREAEEAASPSGLFSWLPTSFWPFN